MYDTLALGDRHLKQGRVEKKHDEFNYVANNISYIITQIYYILHLHIRCGDILHIEDSLGTVSVWKCSYT